MSKQEKSQEQLIAEIEDLKKQIRKIGNGYLDTELGYVLLNLIEDPISVVDPEMRYVFANRKAVQLLNTDSESITGKTVHEMFPDHEAIPMTRNLKKVFEEGIIIHKERKFRFSDRTIWLNTQLVPVKSRAGGVERVLSISRDITDRKRGEEALHESEERFRFLAENMADIIWTLDLNFQTTYVSPSVKKILGFTPEERKRQTLAEMVTPESLEKALKTFETEILYEGEQDADRDRSVTIETEYYHAEGHTLWMENILKAIRDKDGGIVGFYGASRDITERKQAEEALRLSSEKYRELVDLLPQVVYETDAMGNLTFVNQYAFDLFQYTQKDLERGVNALQMIVPEDHEKAVRNISEVMAGKMTGSTEYIMQKKDGTRFPVIIHSTRIVREGRPVGLRGIIIDNTERKKTEKKLQASEKKFRQIFENALTPYYETSLEGTLQEISPSVERYLKYTRKELIGSPIVSLYADPVQRDRFINKLLQEGELIDEEILVRDKDGAILHALLTAKYIKEESKIVGSLLDITKRKKAEQALRDSEELFRTTVNAMNEGLVVTDTDFKPIFANPKMYASTGYDERDLPDLNIENFYTPESQSKLMAVFAENIATRNVLFQEVQIVKKDGTIADYLLSGSLILKEGKFWKAVATFTDISDIKRGEEEREKTILELEKALKSIKTLSGLLPICASCKKIRDDKGYWNQIESYIETHSEALFSHGICPKCAETLYGDTDWFKKSKSENKSLFEDKDRDPDDPR
ncbi:PAS domain S-box protein [bacterium]|nr:PAS domain S-box protein [bacterium]